MENLFIELIKIKLGTSNVSININILANTIQYYAGLDGFNTKPVEYWYCVVSNAGVKYQPNN